MRHNHDRTFTGNIAAVRAVEDCIRATKKYTEGIGTRRSKHPIQGEEFPSRVFIKYYEVYPDIELSWDMPAGTALDWLWGETSSGKKVRCIDVLFNYDYRQNKAEMILRRYKVDTMPQLQNAVPGLVDRVAALANGDRS